MEGVISTEDRIAIAEVDYVINHMNERYLKMIPLKVRDFISIAKKRDVQVYVDPKVPLEEQGLKEFTLYFLLILNLKYWCDDERKKEILAKLEYNQKKIDDRIYNIFDQAENMKTVSESVEVQENKPKEIVRVGEKTSDEMNQQIEQAQENTEENNNELVEKPRENFFTRFINKIKSLVFKNK